MTEHLKKTCFVLVVGFLALLFAPSVAFACSCEIPPIGKNDKQLVKLEREKSKAVFSGEVTEIIFKQTIPGEPAPVAEVRFKVLQSWKGVGTNSVTVLTANICCICGYSFKVGERYLVYAYGSNEDESFWTNICTRTKYLSEASKDLQSLGKAKVSKR